MSALKSVAPWNMERMVVTPETFQPATPPVSVVAPLKALDRSVVPDRLGASAAVMVRFCAP